MNPLFFQTVFLGDAPSEGWPEDFFVLTACEPMGNRKASPSFNQAADERLQRRLSALSLKHFRVTGASPDLSHQEPGWGIVGADRALIHTLAREFDQEAYFSIQGGQVFLCAGLTDEPVPIAVTGGFFRDRWRGM